MFTTRKVYYFTPFYFPNGNPSKPKFGIVLGEQDKQVILLSLPTSKNHIPESIELSHG